MAEKSLPPSQQRQQPPQAEDNDDHSYDDDNDGDDVVDDDGEDENDIRDDHLDNDECENTGVMIQRLQKDDKSTRLASCFLVSFMSSIHSFYFISFISFHFISFVCLLVFCRLSCAMSSFSLIQNLLSVHVFFLRNHLIRNQAKFFSKK